MLALATPHSWRLSMKNTPILTRLLHQIDNLKIVTYSQKRDGYREAVTI